MFGWVLDFGFWSLRRTWDVTFALASMKLLLHIFRTSSQNKIMGANVLTKRFSTMPTPFWAQNDYWGLSFFYMFQGTIS